MQKYVILGDTLTSEEPLGVQRFAEEILRELDELELNFELQILVPENRKLRLKFKNIAVKQFGNYQSPFIWRQFTYPRYVKREGAVGVDLTLGLSILGSGVVAAHDCIYEKYPKNFQSAKDILKRCSYLFRMRNNLRKASAIITVSHYSKNELVDYYRLPDEKVHVIYNGWQHYQRNTIDVDILCKLGLEKNCYLFALGSSLPHKNFEWIVKAAIQNPKYMFVVTGTNRLSNYVDVLEGVCVNNVKFTGYLSDNEVKTLMSNALAYMHPSLYEGFGIPPLEALSTGTKVVISNQTCLPEIYGDAAIYFDPFDAKINIDELLSQHAEPPEEILQKYSWKSSANALAEIMNNLKLKIEVKQ